MANDATSKSTTNNNNTENTSPPSADQQKIPPLKIVLHSSGNQKNSSIVAVNQSSQQTVREKQQDARSEAAPKAGNRVRIKLGTFRNQVSAKTASGNSNDLASSKASSESGQKLKNSTTERQEDDASKEVLTESGLYPRRVTRRSHKTVQIAGNEDEESMSSMTSADENQCNNNPNATSDTNTAQDNTANAPSTTTSTSTSNTSTVTTTISVSAANGSNSADTPKRYKRRKCEPTDSQFTEIDSLLCAQNYKLPTQNSIELFKSIREQIDKRIKNLNIIHPRTPHGFRDYMLNRGSYLLAGNKLGNGTNLFMNEDGGLNAIPVGKFHAFRHGKIQYSVPNRAKVPLCLPVNSPLYDLFIDQEKERYKMRIEHIKEREKLTLAAEQEIIRVYNQAALAAANQDEPFSVCTMLKHQEVYNYLDSDGSTLLCREDAQRDQVKPDGVRTRRRHHPSPPSPTRKASTTEEPGASGAKVETKVSNEGGLRTQTEDTKPKTTKPSEGKSPEESDSPQADESEKKSSEMNEDSPTEQKPKPSTSESIEDDKRKEKDPEAQTQSSPAADMAIKDQGDGSPKEPTQDDDSNKPESSSDEPMKDVADKANSSKDGQDAEEDEDKDAAKSEQQDNLSNQDGEFAESQSTTSKQGSESNSASDEKGISDQNREAFFIQLQEIDDKWDRIRNEMLIRHRNEAESLNAIQRLEWEWKTKEIGVCDVRSTPIIDNTLVPKLNIHLLDY